MFYFLGVSHEGIIELLLKRAECVYCVWLCHAGHVMLTVLESFISVDAPAG